MAALITEGFINLRMLVQLLARALQDPNYNSDMIAPIYGLATRHQAQPTGLPFDQLVRMAFGK